MMFHTQGASRNSCSLLAVCGRTYEDKQEKDAAGDQRRYPFPELASSGRLEVRSLTSPKVEEFHRALDSFRPNVVYLQGEQLPSDEVGSLVWEDYELSSLEAVSRLFGSRLPTTVYLEVPNGEEVAEAIHSRGIPYVIYWKNTISCYAAAHFRQALFSVIQSSPCHTWDAFQVAHASFKLYCIDNSLVHHSGSNKVHSKSGPSLFGDPPTIDVALPEIDAEKDEDSSESSHSAIQIHEEEVCARFLVCGVACSSDAYLLGCLEDGLNALLSIEMRGSKLHNRFSAPPPPLQAGGLARGLLTMRCDMSTGSTAHISLLVSGSAQTCFDDQQLENHIKKEVVERNQLVQAVSPSDDNKSPLFEPRKSASIACDTAVFEVCVKVPSWALQVLRQLAPEASYRNLVALGIASVQGLAVASFEKEDAERLLFFSTRPGKDSQTDHLGAPSPSWLRPPQPSRKRVAPGHPRWCTQGAPAMDRETRYCRSMNGVSTPAVPERHKLKAPAMRPIPHSHLHKVIPFTGVSQQDNHEVGPVKANLSGAPSSTRHGGSGSTPIPYRKLSSNSYQAKQIISLNPIPLKKHGCGRAPIQLCSEEEFLKDVMHFLMHRGHTRLIPQSGLSEFPDAILNSKRLDLYNLYREVVSRGGFHVGNGINWKGQVFSKMRNYTSTNKMTGVGNTLKRHYETYLLEYELAHDDVDGECCLLCRSSAAGDWVNCGICGEWAHFGCDRRQGLGAFKDYAKTDGLEYICPPCSIANFKKKIPKPSNGFSEGLTYSQPV